jgi:hypothetical protein
MSDYIPPTVGPESDEYRAVCVFAPMPGEPQCSEPATRHLRVDDEGAYGEVALAACDSHVPIARATGRLIQEHVYEGVCGFPATIWHEVLNVCVLDDSGVSLGAREASAVGAS